MIGSFQKLSCGLSRNFVHPIFRFSPSKFRIVLYPENSLIAQSLVAFVTSLGFYMTVSNVQTDRRTERKTYRLREIKDAAILSLSDSTKDRSRTAYMYTR